MNSLFFESEFDSFSVKNFLPFYRYLFSWSQSDLAFRCELSKNTISSIELGSGLSLNSAFRIFFVIDLEFHYRFDLHLEFTDIFYPFDSSFEDGSFDQFNLRSPLHDFLYHKYIRFLEEKMK